MKIQFHLRDASSNNETRIYARISYKGQRLKYYTKHSILPSNWDKVKKRAIGKSRDASYINNELDNFINIVKDEYVNYELNNNRNIPTTETLGALIDKKYKSIERIDPKSVEKKLTFMEYFEEFIKRTKDGVRTNGSITKFSKNTIKNYSMTESLLKDFAKDELYKLDFDSINMNFYELLMAFMNKRKYKINTKGKHIATIKNLMNDATDRGYNTNLIFRSKNFKRLSEEVFNIYLTKDEINDIANLDLSNNSRRDIIRDLFLIGCYTGQSYIDYSNFNKNNIHGDFIKYSRAKNPNVSFKNEINIPIKHELLKILEKYDYKLPKTFSNQKTNKHLKEIGKMVDSLNVLIEINLDGKKTYKYNCIGTHTARRSFASNEYIDGTPSLSIMQLTGHKTEKSFMKYIKLSSKEHAQIIKKTWDERSQNKLKVII